MSEPLLEVENLAVTFPTDGGDLYAVRGLSYHVAPREVVCAPELLGESAKAASLAPLRANFTVHFLSLASTPVNQACNLRVR